MSIGARIVEHLFGKRSDAPVGELVLLVGFEIGELAKKVSQAPSRVSENGASVICIEKTNQVQAEISLQPDGIHESTVKNLGRVSLERSDALKIKWVCLTLTILGSAKTSFRTSSLCLHGWRVSITQSFSLVLICMSDSRPV